MFFMVRFENLQVTTGIVLLDFLDYPRREDLVCVDMD